MGKRRRQLDSFEVLLTVLVSFTALEKLSLALQTKIRHSLDVGLRVVLAQVAHHALAVIDNSLHLACSYSQFYKQHKLQSTCLKPTESFLVLFVLGEVTHQRIDARR
jgi:hypothetical protein